MTTPTPLPEQPLPGADWEGQGYRLGATLGDRHAVVVLGADRDATALVALGIARAQASRHRVALGDLLGDAPPIQRLVAGDDPHGLVDSFLYGVSINKIAHRVDEKGQLFVLPSGSEPPDYDEMLASPRWRRLASGFREEKALLVLAVPADAPHVADLVASTDGAIVVGGGGAAPLPADQVIATVSPAVVEAAAEPAAEATDEVPPAAPLIPALPAPPGSRRFATRRVAAGAGIVLTAILVAVGVWLAVRPLAGGYRPFWARTHGDTASAAGALPSILDAGARADSARAGAAPGAAPALLAPANPADSASASAYSVELVKMNTIAGAEGAFQDAGRSSMPAATYAPVLVQGAIWYRVMVGASRDSTQADSLRRALRAHGDLRADLGQLVRAPYAFLVDSGLTPAAAPRMISYWAQRGQPIYALRQDDGTVRLYAGAFESPREAQLFVESLRDAGIAPVLVYRIGRAI